MKKLLLIITIPVLLPVLIAAQERVKIEKSEFILPDVEGGDEAWRSVREGDRCYELGGGLYREGAAAYLLALGYNDENAALNYKMGVCSLFGDDPQGALPYFLKAHSLDVDVARDLVLLMGRAYQFRGDYGKAIDCYNMYTDNNLEEGKIDPNVSRYINECNLAIESGGPSGLTEVINAGESVNSPYDDYAPVTAKGENLLYFTTRRPLDEKTKLQQEDQKSNENVFAATGTVGAWGDSGPAGSDIASELNEGVLWVNDENTFMLVYAGWQGNGDILVSENDRGRWKTPSPFLDEVATSARETSAVLTPGMDQLFFTSDRKQGNLGGRDIYFMRKLKKNRWTKPYNLGPAVNSEGNEEAVWCSVTGDTIWFSSNGRAGFGGYDIFMSVRDNTGAFGEAVNMGMPYNSQWNDLFYRPSVIDRRRGLLSSNRPGGLGGLDIYIVRLLLQNMGQK